jgi:glyoxylase-like metal-dependent hydrolase (beta-lactamase superfamily II)
VPDTTSAGAGFDWTEPTAEEVVDGVFRIPLPLPNDGLRAVNVYAIRNTSGRLTLVDSGWSIPQARDLLLGMLDKLGHGPADIDRFLVTHIHRDHYTLAVALRREFGTKVAIGAGERPSFEVILSPGHRPFERELLRMKVMGAEKLMEELTARFSGPGDVPPPPDTAAKHHWELPDTWLRPSTVDIGDRRLDVVATPGHTQGHVVYHDTDNAVLFAGDHVLPTITPSIGLEPVIADNPLGDFLESLKLVRSRPDAKLLPAHGAATDSVHTRVDELLDHHGRRLDQTEAAVLRGGATTGYEAAQQLKWTRREKDFTDLDPFNQMMAVGETGAHLDLLVIQGRLSVVDRDGVRRYSEAS